MSTQMKRQEIPKGSIYFLGILFQKGWYWRGRKKIITIREYSNTGTVITNSSPPWYIITDTVAWVVVCGQQMDKQFSFIYIYIFFFYLWWLRWLSSEFCTSLSPVSNQVTPLPCSFFSPSQLHLDETAFLWLSNKLWQAWITCFTEM